MVAEVQCLKPSLLAKQSDEGTTSPLQAFTEALPEDRDGSTDGNSHTCRWSHSVGYNSCDNLRQIKVTEEHGQRHCPLVATVESVKVCTTVFGAYMCHWAFRTCNNCMRQGLKGSILNFSAQKALSVKSTQEVLFSTKDDKHWQPVYCKPLSLPSTALTRQ